MDLQLTPLENSDKQGSNPPQRVLIAIGGNALYDKHSGVLVDTRVLETLARDLVAIIQAGYSPVITFGNGPQVGQLLDMAETSVRMFARPVTLDTCVAWTQGEIGYKLLNILQNKIWQAKLPHTVLSVQTSVVVNPDDPAFQNPTKPIGRFITPEEADQLYVERGWIIGPDSNRGYRRMVPSPKPQRVLEMAALIPLIQDPHVIPLCGGGGGVPVFIDDTGIHPIEAVVDKDYTSCVLAKSLNIPNLLICTEVDAVYLHYGQPEQVALRTVTLSEAEKYMAQGHFSAGSMGPKVAALLDYLRISDNDTIPIIKRAMIGSVETMLQTLLGKAGTAFCT